MTPIVLQFATRTPAGWRAYVHLRRARLIAARLREPRAPVSRRRTQQAVKIVAAAS